MTTAKGDNGDAAASATRWQYAFHGSAQPKTYNLKH